MLCGPEEYGNNPHVVWSLLLKLRERRFRSLNTNVGYPWVAEDLFIWIILVFLSPDCSKCLPGSFLISIQGNGVLMAFSYVLFVWSNPSSLSPLYTSNPHLDSLSPSISLSNFFKSNLLHEFPDKGLISRSPSSELSLLAEWSQHRDSAPQRFYLCFLTGPPNTLQTCP